LHPPSVLRKTTSPRIHILHFESDTLIKCSCGASQKHLTLASTPQQQDVVYQRLSSSNVPWRHNLSFMHACIFTLLHCNSSHMHAVSCRWTENWDWFVNRLNAPRELDGDTFFRVTFEQSVFRDATCSAMVGRPRFYHRCVPVKITSHLCAGPPRTFYQCTSSKLGPAAEEWLQE
jgi:hypothetical protein